MRAAITIIYNGLHHLTNKGFSQFMVENFDYWVIVEGASQNGGSTSWCKHQGGSHTSSDGTVEFIKQLEKENPHVLTYSHHKHYKSKDEQFNKGIILLKTKINSCYLWQVDADEHWRIEDINRAERILWKSPSNVGAFKFNHYVKDDIIAVGDWGSGSVNRLWKWKGQLFDRHEPAIMLGQKKPEELPMKFEHYSLTHEQDVKFKAKLYRGHEKIYENWKKLDHKKFPCHIRELFGPNNSIGRSNTYLHKIEQPCVNVPNQENQESKLPC